MIFVCEPQTIQGYNGCTFLLSLLASCLPNCHVVHHSPYYTIYKQSVQSTICKHSVQSTIYILQAPCAINNRQEVFCNVPEILQTVCLAAACVDNCLKSELETVWLKLIDQDKGGGLLCVVSSDRSSLCNDASPEIHVRMLSFTLCQMPILTGSLHINA